MSDSPLTVDAFLTRFNALPGVKLFPPMDEAGLKILPPDARRAMDTMPALHRELLQRTNGLSAWSGYFRLFGFGYTPQGAPDAFIWNLPNMWKFTWPGQVAEFFCFGDDGWGNQYVYRTVGMALKPEAGIFRLDWSMLAPTQIADTFEQFLEREWLVNARGPRDVKLAQAAAQFGPLATDQLLNYMPSPLLGGAETPENLRVLNARQAMILNGDIFSQWNTAPKGSVLQRIDTQMDRLGVMRLKLVFSPPASQ
ncbi:MAG TPA: hypothetical protein VL860_15190 [Planctomycetota bacterium]|nr:hypothetical protein [Planctomycetota bacterium]